MRDLSVIIPLLFKSMYPILHNPRIPHSVLLSFLIDVPFVVVDPLMDLIEAAEILVNLLVDLLHSHNISSANYVANLGILGEIATIDLINAILVHPRTILL
ncbi:hypothetical protein VNO77_41804 [Canavalia gladiata]|uniref:Uncharacterized protein n=1 Tax=Canavalia gladiata TaxID=3824 RepID=A0AAN9K185_CANGL